MGGFVNQKKVKIVPSMKKLDGSADKMDNSQLIKSESPVRDGTSTDDGMYVDHPTLQDEVREVTQGGTVEYKVQVEEPFEKIEKPAYYLLTKTQKEKNKRF